MRTPTERQLSKLLRARIAAAVPEGTGAEIKNLVEAYCRLRDATGQGPEGPRSLTVRFEGDADDYSR